MLKCTNSKIIRQFFTTRLSFFVLFDDRLSNKLRVFAVKLNINTFSGIFSWHLTFCDRHTTNRANARAEAEDQSRVIPLVDSLVSYQQTHQQLQLKRKGQVNLGKYLDVTCRYLASAFGIFSDIATTWEWSAGYN